MRKNHRNLELGASLMQLAIILSLVFVVGVIGVSNLKEIAKNNSKANDPGRYLNTSSEVVAGLRGARAVLFSPAETSRRLKFVLTDYKVSTGDTKICSFLAYNNANQVFIGHGTAVCLQDNGEDLDVIAESEIPSDVIQALRQYYTDLGFREELTQIAFNFKERGGSLETRYFAIRRAATESFNTEADMDLVFDPLIGGGDPWVFKDGDDDPGIGDDDDPIIIVDDTDDIPVTVDDEDDLTTIVDDEDDLPITIGDEDDDATEYIVDDADDAATISDDDDSRARVTDDEDDRNFYEGGPDRERFDLEDLLGRRPEDRIDFPNYRDEVPEFVEDMHRERDVPSRHNPEERQERINMLMEDLEMTDPEVRDRMLEDPEARDRMFEDPYIQVDSLEERRKIRDPEVYEEEFDEARVYDGGEYVEEDPQLREDRSPYEEPMFPEERPLREPY